MWTLWRSRPPGITSQHCVVPSRNSVRSVSSLGNDVCVRLLPPHRHCGTRRTAQIYVVSGPGTQRTATPPGPAGEEIPIRPRMKEPTPDSPYHRTAAWIGPQIVGVWHCVVLAVKTLLHLSADDPLPPSHSYTHRIRCASPVLGGRSGVI